MFTEIIKRKEILDSFKEIEKLVSEYREARIQIFEKYEKKSRTIFIFIWLAICFLFIPLTFVGACMLFTLLLLYFLIPGVAETKKIERAGFFFWRNSFKTKVTLQRDQIILRLLLLSNSVKKMQYYSKWASVALDARKIMGV